MKQFPRGPFQANLRFATTTRHGFWDCHPANVEFADYQGGGCWMDNFGVRHPASQAE